MFPLYCNKCFRREKYETSLQLFISRCGHILCIECIEENCCICEHSFNSVPINKDMPTSMAQYFSSPMKQYQHYKKVMKFHHEQERIFVANLCRSNAEENEKGQDEMNRYAKLNDKIKREIEKEREKVRKLREYISYYEERSEQVNRMTPPLISQTRPRLPARNNIMKNMRSNPVNNNTPKRFTQQIRPRMILNSPTLSDNSNPLSTVETVIVPPIAKKVRTPPPLLPFFEHNILHQQFQ